MITSVADSSDCATGFHFGTIDLGQSGYVNNSVTFGGGSGGGSGCNNSASTGCSTIHWDGHNTLTVTLGNESSGQPTHAAPSIVIYTPDAALGLSGTLSSAKEENF